MGGNWPPGKRCDEIELRLDNYRQDGLVALFSRTAPSTPGQEVICAKTLTNRNNCSLVLTLDVGVDGYVALREMSEALPTAETVYHNDEAIAANSQFSPESPIIYLEPYLALEDLRELRNPVFAAIFLAFCVITGTLGILIPEQKVKREDGVKHSERKIFAFSRHRSPECFTPTDLNAFGGN